jgi:hypothetical protein
VVEPMRGLRWMKQCGSGKARVGTDEYRATTASSTGQGQNEAGTDEDRAKTASSTGQGQGQGHGTEQGGHQ